MGARRTALRLHDRAEDLLREIAAPSAPVTEALMELIDSMGDYDEDAGEVISDAAKQMLVFTFMRGYTIRLASDQPIEVPMPDEDPTSCALEFLQPALDDEWFYGQAFPHGSKVWERLSETFAGAAESMLLEDQPDGPTFPSEVIDQMLRFGYMGAHVDQWFELSPMYRDGAAETPSATATPADDHAAPESTRLPVSEWSAQRLIQQSVLCVGSDPDEFDVRSAIVLHQDPSLLPGDAQDRARAEAEEQGESFSGFPEFVVFKFAFSEEDRESIYMEGDRTSLVYGVDAVHSVTGAEQCARGWVGAKPIDLPFQHLPGVYQAAFIEYVTGSQLLAHESEFMWALPPSAPDAEYVAFREFPPRTKPTEVTPDPAKVSFGLLPRVAVDQLYRSRRWERL